MDRDGQVVTSTVSSAYPQGCCATSGATCWRCFARRATAQMPLAEVSIHFASLRITAREMRGGAIIFLFPQTALLTASQPDRL